MSELVIQTYKTNPPTSKRQTFTSIPFSPSELIERLSKSRSFPRSNKPFLPPKCVFLTFLHRFSVRFRCIFTQLCFYNALNVVKSITPEIVGVDRVDFKICINCGHLANIEKNLSISEEFGCRI
ncbi:hypothetical protein NPIL_471201 [Nephila pilipes]|uniref:Uncharacterized protein n=1 Tax=Nephila pilipes TaxID=299642 RepID=A0A8X6TK17_NEPPI|nr:hypothetical protein NPIL_471201 [Nephila pilipes]